MDEGLTSVIIVTADSGKCTRLCVDRVLASDAPVEVILVDNGSSDGQPEAIARALQDEPRLKVLYNRANLGFSRAVNRGAAVAQGGYLLILNPDCMILKDTVRKLQEGLASHLQAGLIGAVICGEHGLIDPASRRLDPYLKRTLATLRGTDAQGDQGIYVQGPMPDGVTEEEAVSGALMMLRLRAFEHVEGMDEGYFLHFEDLDLCRRLRDAGYKVLLHGGVRVAHMGGTSSNHRALFVSRHKHAGMWRWFRTYDPAAHNPFKAALVWCGIWVHYLLEARKYVFAARKKG